MKLSLTTLRRCLARLTERSQDRIRYCACARTLLPPTSTHFSSELCRRLVDGVKRLFSEKGLDSGIRAQMALYDDSVRLESFMQKATLISQRLSACHTAEASLFHPPPVPQYQNQCKWIQHGYQVMRALASIVPLPIITLEPTPSDPHVLR